MTHRTGALHEPLLESDERPADAASHDAGEKHRSEVCPVLLRVAYELERDGPRPGNSDEREAARLVWSVTQHFGATSRRRGSDHMCTL